MRKVFRKLYKVITYPFSLKVMMAEGVLYSIWYEFCLKLRLYKYTKKLQHNKDNALQDPSDDAVLIASVRKVGLVLKKYAPWRPKCHNLALTAKKMLLKRNIGSTVHIGFKIDKNGDKEGHAWVKHCNKLVVGDIKGLSEFKELS